MELRFSGLLKSSISDVVAIIRPHVPYMLGNGSTGLSACWLITASKESLAAIALGQLQATYLPVCKKSSQKRTSHM